MPQEHDYTADDVWEQEVTKGGQGTGEFELCPAGNYPATIIGLIDVGTHEKENDDKELYDSRQLVLVVEAQKLTTKGARFIFSKLFTWSMRDNSNWYKLVCGLTGRKFSEGEKFDPRKVLGMACFANVTHQDSASKKTGKTKTYHNLENITQFPEGFPAPTEHRDLIAWSVKEGAPMPALGWVPPVYGQSIEKLVNLSKEARGLLGSKSAKPANGSTLADQVQEQIINAPAAAQTEDIPF
jgi:hypothetical protein